MKWNDSVHLLARWYPSMDLPDQNVPPEPPIESPGSGPFVSVRHRQDDTIAAGQAKPGDRVLKEPPTDPAVTPAFLHL
jgi:hypothetical protein